MESLTEVPSLCSQGVTGFIVNNTDLERVCGLDGVFDCSDDVCGDACRRHSVLGVVRGAA